MAGDPIGFIDPFGLEKEEETVYDASRIGEVKIVIEAKRTQGVNPATIKAAKEAVGACKMLGVVASLVSPGQAAAKGVAQGESMLLHIAGALAEEITGEEITPPIEGALKNIEHIHDVRCTQYYKVWMRAKIKRIEKAGVAKRVFYWVFGSGGLLKGEWKTVATGDWVLMHVNTKDGPHRGGRPMGGNEWFWGEETPTEDETEDCVDRAVEQVREELENLSGQE